MRWPFLIGGRLLEITPASGMTVDASDALIAALAAGVALECAQHSSRHLM